MPHINISRNLLRFSAQLIFLSGFSYLIVFINLKLTNSILGYRVEKIAVLLDWISILFLTWVLLLFSRKKQLTYILSLLFTVMLGLGSCLKFKFLKESLDFSEFKYIKEFAYAMPVTFSAPIFVFLSVIIILFCFNLNFKLIRRRFIYLITGGLLVTGVAFIFSSKALTLSNRHLWKWKLKPERFTSVGVIPSLLYQVIFKINSQDWLSKAESVHTPYETMIPELSTIGIKKQRNVHYIILESLTDPYERELYPEKDPFHPHFRSWLSGTALSPTFGGGSAQGEFEVLCGLPALYIGGGAVVHLLKGKRVPCLPSLLSDLGYVTEVVNPEEPYIYNEYTAYKSIGFSSSYFRDSLTKISFDGYFVSSRSTLEFARNRISKLHSEKHPFLFFTFIESGHYPFILNHKERPQTYFTNFGPLANKFLSLLEYNTLEVAKHVDWIYQQDNDAIVVILGDHQIPDIGTIKNKDKNSHSDSRDTPLIVLNRFKSVQLGEVSHFDIPYIILSLLKEERPQTMAQILGQNKLRPLKFQPWNNSLDSETLIMAELRKRLAQLIKASSY